MADASHLRRTISEYAFRRTAVRVFSIGVVLLALGSAFTLLAAVRQRLTRHTSVASLCLMLWTIGLVAVVAVPSKIGRTTRH